MTSNQHAKNDSKPTKMLADADPNQLPLDFDTVEGSGVAPKEISDNRMQIFWRAIATANDFENEKQGVLMSWTDGSVFSSSDLRALVALAARSTGEPMPPFYRTMDKEAMESIGAFEALPSIFKGAEPKF